MMRRHPKTLQATRLTTMYHCAAMGRRGTEQHMGFGASENEVPADVVIVCSRMRKPISDDAGSVGQAGGKQKERCDLRGWETRPATKLYSWLELTGSPFGDSQCYR